LLRRRTFVTTELPVPQIPQHVVWRDADGREISPHDWERQGPRTLQLIIRSSPNDDDSEGAPPLLLLFNADERPRDFVIPATGEENGEGWNVELDTSNVTGASPLRVTPEQSLTVPGESLLLARVEDSP
jgi:pullulanase/glycogen debranching enzyme